MTIRLSYSLRDGSVAAHFPCFLYLLQSPSFLLVQTTSNFILPSQILLRQLDLLLRFSAVIQSSPSIHSSTCLLDSSEEALHIATIASMIALTNLLFMSPQFVMPKLGHSPDGSFRISGVTFPCK